MKAVDEFIALDPKDARGAELLTALVSKYIVSPDTKTALTDRLTANYTDSSKSASTTEKQPESEAVGKPFALEFMDAISGSPVSIQRLKGKVVVVDFWATWCGPCVAEMPKMKSLYAEYKNKGVQFIGVSLDQNGSRARQAHGLRRGERNHLAAVLPGRTAGTASSRSPGASIRSRLFSWSTSRAKSTPTKPAASSKRSFPSCSSGRP